MIIIYTLLPTRYQERELFSCGQFMTINRHTAGHVRGDQFWPAVRQFTAQNFKTKRKKKLLPRYISERKLTCLWKSVEGLIKEGKNI